MMWLKRGIHRRYVSGLSPYGLGSQQAIVLRFVANHQGTSLAEASRVLAFDPAATTKAVDGLIKHGLLERTDHPTDRRRWILNATPKGIDLYRQVEQVHAAMNAEFDAALTPQQHKALASIFEQLTRVFPV